MSAAAVFYWDFRDELSTYNRIIYKGERICIPPSLRREMLMILHSSHLGMVKTKQRARVVIYSLGMNTQIEEIISKCKACLKYRNKQQKEPMTIHSIPSLPWKKVGTDLFEQNGNHYMVIVDYYSNFIEVAPLLTDTRASTIIRHIKSNITCYGIMVTLISDNRPQYISAEFDDFTKKFSITHIMLSPVES